MRIPILLASAAALALSACDGNPLGSAGGEQSQSINSEAAKQLREALKAAPSHGLTVDLFHEGDLDTATEGQLREAALAYASALANGKVDPTKIREIYTVPRPKVDVRAGFEQALSEDRVGEWIESLAPQTAEYRALSQAFVRLVESSPDLEGADIPTGDAIKPGDTDPRVPAIARNLRAQGYLPAEAQPSEQQEQQQRGADQQGGGGVQPQTAFTPQMSQALAQWQADAGLKSDGIVGPNTVEQLNAGPRDRARQLAVAMERLRWLERQPPATRIDVNTAATLLDYFRDGQHQGRRKVVNGEPGWETPQLGSPIFRLVANPTWTVPDSIVEDEISQKSSGWLARNNFTRKNGRWVQQPGPENALGEVKFDMQNDHAIYLHDTPAKALFGQDERHRSHGCVRVEGALDFARTLAQADGVLAEFDRALASGKETFVDLNREIPVRLMYHTAYLGTDGRIKFAQDVYGWDNDVAEALGYETRQRDRVEHRRGADVGP